MDNPVSIGIVVLGGSTLDGIENSFPKRGGSDLMKDLIRHFIKIGKPVYGYLPNAF